MSFLCLIPWTSCHLWESLDSLSTSHSLTPPAIIAFALSGLLFPCSWRLKIACSRQRWMPSAFSFLNASGLDLPIPRLLDSIACKGKKLTPSCHPLTPRRDWSDVASCDFERCAHRLGLSMNAKVELFRRRKSDAQCEWTRPPGPLNLLWHLSGPMLVCSQLLLLDVSESQRRLGQTMNWRGVCGQTRWRNMRNHRRPYCVGPPWFAVAEHPCPQREAQWDHWLGEFGVVSVPLATSRAAQHSCGISKTHMCHVGGRWVPARDGGCIPGIKDAAILPSSISGCNSRIRLPGRHSPPSPLTPLPPPSLPPHFPLPFP